MLPTGVLPQLINIQAGTVRYPPIRIYGRTNFHNATIWLISLAYLILRRSLDRQSDGEFL